MAKLETFSLSAVRQALGCSLGELGVRQGLALQKSSVTLCLLPRQPNAGTIQGTKKKRHTKGGNQQTEEHKFLQNPVTWSGFG